MFESGVSKVVGTSFPCTSAFDSFRTIGVLPFVVAHGLSTVSQADNILVMEQNRSVEHGTHDERHSVDDLYAEMEARQSDGTIDRAEQEKILSQFGDVSCEEVEFLRAEFQRPLDVHEFAHSVPAGMEQEVYAISLMAIDLDTRGEAHYLRELGECLRISPEISNALHHRYGAPCLYK